MFRRLRQALTRGEAAGSRGANMVLVRTTVGTRGDAERMAKRLLDEKVAACVHVAEVASLYLWEGRRTQETEYIVEARTFRKLQPDVQAAMEQGHPYKVPFVEAWCVDVSPQAYVAWAQSTVR